MVENYFEPGARRGEKVRQLFTRIAPRYDLINDLQSLGLHRRWKRRVVEMAGPVPGSRALDVCCGTGDLALALAARGAETVGLDFTQAMLDVAARRVAAGGGGLPVRFQQGDALHLPFPDDTFEIVTVGYGLRNLASWEAGLAEMCRVLRPGGRLLVLEFGLPEQRWWRALYFAYLRLFVPLLGLVFAGDAGAYAYILESLRHYPGQHGVDRHLRLLGLVDTRIISFLGGVMTINWARKSPAGVPVAISM